MTLTHDTHDASSPLASSPDASLSSPSSSQGFFLRLTKTLSSECDSRERCKILLRTWQSCLLQPVSVMTSLEWVLLWATDSCVLDTEASEGSRQLDTQVIIRQVIITIITRSSITSWTTGDIGHHHSCFEIVNNTFWQNKFVSVCSSLNQSLRKGPFRLGIAIEKKKVLDWM